MADYSRLKALLPRTDLQQKNPALFQLLNQLLDNNVQQQQQTTAQIAENLTGLRLVTWANDQAEVPLSRLLTAGTGITFDETVFGALTLNATGGDLPKVITINTSILTGTVKVASLSIEIADGIELEIQDDAGIEIIGSANGNELAYLNVSTEQTGPAFNISTLGTIDWLSLNATTTIPNSATATHAKFKGPQWLLNTFKWQNAAGLATFTSNVTISSTASDDLSASGALASNTTNTRNVINGDDFGWSFNVPVLPNLQVLRIFAGNGACDGLLTITFTNGLKSYTYQVNTTLGGSSASNVSQFKISYWGAPCDMVVSFVAKNHLGTTPNITFIAAYIASL